MPNITQRLDPDLEHGPGPVVFGSASLAYEIEHWELGGGSLGKILALLPFSEPSIEFRAEEVIELARYDGVKRGRNLTH